MASRIIKTLIIISGLLVIIGVAGFYSLPTLLKSRLPVILQRQIDRKSSISDIEIHLSPLFVSVHGFEMKEQNGRLFAAFDTLHIKINARQSIKLSALVIDEVRLKKPFVRIAREKNGTFNFQNLFGKDTVKQPGSRILPVTIAKLSLSEGKLAWEDAHFNKPVKEDVEPINADIENFTVQTDKAFNLSLTLTLSSGTHLDWKGSVGISPLTSEGHIKVDKVDLQKILAVTLPDTTRFDLQGSGLVNADYKLRYANKNLSVTADKARADIHGFQYAEQGLGARLAKIADFSHETDINCTYNDKGLTLSANKSRIAIHDFQYTEKERLVKIPGLTLETDFNAAHAENGWRLAANKAKIDGQDFQYSQKERSLKIGKLTHETDFKGDFTNTGWQLAVNKTKIDGQDLQYSQKEQLLKIGKLTHETDFKGDFTANDWQIAVTKAKVDSRSLQLSRPGLDNILVKIPTVALGTAYKIDYADKNLSVTGNQGAIDSRDFQLSEQVSEKGKDKELVKIPVFSAQGIDFNLNRHELKITSVAAKGADVQAWLNADGTLNYQSLMPHDAINAVDLNRIKTAPEGESAHNPKPAELTTSPPGNTVNKAASGNIAEKKTPWNIQVDTLALTDSGAVFEDRRLEKPVTFTFSPINFKLTNYSNKSGATLPFQLSAGVNKNGLIKLDGDTVIEPLSANITTEINNIDLETFQPYFDKFVRLEVIDGLFNLDGKLSIAKQEPDKLDLKFNGNSGIENLLTRDRKVHKDFVKWDNLALKNIAVDLLAKRYTASALVIDKPYARVTIRKDKTVNFSDLVITEKSKPEAPVKTISAQQAEQNKPYFKLDKLQIRDGSSDFSDLSLILPFAAQIESLDGGAAVISSEKKSTTTVYLEGAAYDLAPVNIKGEINPHLDQYNVQMNFNGLPMPLVSPYMVQFAGYKVEKGKLTLELNYNVAGRRLTASNKILIDQFELGEKVENPNAVSLPLELAVALLKDSDGKVKIDVPVSGSLDDPKFSIGAIVTDALVGAISKVVSAPFRALGSLLGGDEDLSTITFHAGSSTLVKPQQAKLDALSKALRERPALNLAIKGVVYQEQDWPAIREDALYDQLKIRKAAEINKEGERKIRAQYVKLTEDEYKRLLADMFIEKFPLLAEKSFLGTPQLTNPKAGDFHAIAKQKLFEVIKPEEERLKELASARARAIAKYMVKEGKVQPERVFILDTVIDPKRDNSEIVSTLSLKAN